MPVNYYGRCRMLVIVLGAANCLGYIGFNLAWAGYTQDTTSKVGDLTSRTNEAAPDGTTPDTRLTIGLGEGVQLTLDSSKWADTDENADTGAIENDTIGDRVWTAGGKGAVSPGGVTGVDITTLTASYDPGDATIVLLVYDSKSKFSDDPIIRQMTFTVIKPSGEASRYDHWADPVCFFSATLSPKTVSFNAISVKQIDGAGSSDGCWYMGQTKYDSVGVGNYNVNAQNYYSGLNYGWLASSITHYRANPTGAVRAPCKTTLEVEMHVVQGSSGKYDAFPVEVTIGATTLTTTRDGETSTRTFP